MKHLVQGIAATLLLATGLPRGDAAAEGLPQTSRSEAAAPVSPSWNGFFVGAGMGAGVVVHEAWGTTIKKKATKKATKKVCKKGTVCTLEEGTGDAGIFGTVTIGYDRVIRPGWVAGVFADYDFGSGISSDVSVKGLETLDHNYSWAVGGRLGALVTPRTLLYGTGGYTQADFDTGSLGSTTLEGYFVGAGIETFLERSSTLRLEYRFSRLEPGSDLPNGVELEAEMHTARLVLSYKLNGGH